MSNKLPVVPDGLLPAEEAHPPKCESLPVLPQAFLKAVLAGERNNLCAAERISGVSRRNHYRWLYTVPGYKEAYEEVLQLVKDAHLDKLDEIIERGVTEEVRDANGEIKLTRTKHDASYLKMRHHHLFPEEKGRDGDINVIIVNRVEGKRYHGEGGGGVAGCGEVEGHPKDIPILEAQVIEEHEVEG